jgi:hypothetical protein
MKSIKKTLTMTSARASLFDLNAREEIEKTFDFGCKLSPKKAEKEIKEHCAFNNLILLGIKEIKNNKVTYSMPFDKFISAAEKVEVSDNE